MCRANWKVSINKVHVFATMAFQRIGTKGNTDAKGPTLQELACSFFVRVNPAKQMCIFGERLCIKTIIAEHVETFFRNVNDETLDKVMCGNAFDYFLVIFMALIPKGNMRTVIADDARLCHRRSSDIADNVFGNCRSRIKIRFWSMHIKAILVNKVELAYEMQEFRIREIEGKKFLLQIVKKCGHPAFAQHDIGEIVKLFPWSDLAAGTFGKKHVDMRIPFEIATKSMQDAHHAELKLFFFVLSQSPILNDLCSRAEKDVKQSAIFTKIWAEFLSNGEDNMAVPAVDQFFFNGGSAVILIGRTTSAAESGMATKRNKAFA